MPRRIPIRTKLAAALAVPICALLLVSVLEVRQSAESDRETRSQTELATATAELKEAEKRHKAAGPGLAKAERAVRVADRLVADREARLAELSKPARRLSKT